MKKSLKIGIVLLSLLTVITVSLYLFSDLYIDYHLLPAKNSGLLDKIAITNVFTNSTVNAVFLEVISINKNVTLDSAIIRNDSGTNRAVVPLNVTIPEGQSATIRVNYNCTLSGYYSIHLITDSGRSSFVSPVLAINFVDKPFFVKEIIYDQNQSVILVKCSRIDDRTPLDVGITNSKGGAVFAGYEPLRTQLEDGTELAIHYDLPSGNYSLYLSTKIIPFTVP